MSKLSKVGVTWTNGQISLSFDLIFGVNVLSEDGWLPVSTLDAKDLAYIRRLVDYNPGCPFLDDLAEADAKLKEAAAS